MDRGSEQVVPQSEMAAPSVTHTSDRLDPYYRAQLLADLGGFIRRQRRRIPGGSVSVSVAEVAKRTSITIKVKHAKRTSLRLKLFGALMHVACWIAPMSTTVEITTGVDA